MVRHLLLALSPSGDGDGDGCDLGLGLLRDSGDDCDAIIDRGQG